MRLGSALATGVIVAALLAPAARAAPSPRILFASDWTGPTEIFAADPSGRAPVGQVTFARPAAPCYWAAACGFTKPLPSPDGRWLAYRSGASDWVATALWLQATMEVEALARWAKSSASLACQARAVSVIARWAAIRSSTARRR